MILFFFLSWNYSYCQCAGNLVNNGAFNNAEGENVTALGWGPLSTPDVNDAFGPLNTTMGYSWIGTPIASSNGGTWQNLFNTEAIGQNINVIPGQWYSLHFEYSAQGITAGGGLIFNQPVGAKVYINGSLVYTTPNDSTQYTWENACYTFQASGTMISLKLSASQAQYLAIDGVCLIPSTVNPINLGNDTTVCQGAILFLDATTLNSTYLWQDNSTDSTYLVNQAGTYWVQISNFCVTLTDTIHINYSSLPIFDLGNDTILCPYEIMILNATTLNSTYLWQDNSSDSTFTINESGTYWVSVTNSCGSKIDSIHIDYSELPILNLGNDTSLCKGSTLTLNATKLNASYKWQDNSTSSTYVLNLPGLYWVKIVLENCILTDTILIFEDNCELNIPNAFSPNSDGLNDEFKVIENINIQELQTDIYNRWGQLIFSYNGDSFGWDGKYNGQDCEIGTYFYLIKYKLFDNPEYYYHKGDLLLVR